jgi:hypothetical protein
MSQPSAEVKLEIVESESKSGKHLVFQYKVNHPDRSSKNCREMHLRKLNDRKATKACLENKKDLENKEDNLIRLKFNFDISYSETGDSYKIMTNEKKNAKKIQDCFFALAFGIEDHGQGCYFRLRKTYFYDQWYRKMNPRVGVKDSSKKVRSRSDSTPAKKRLKSWVGALSSKLRPSSRKKD